MSQLSGAEGIRGIVVGVDGSAHSREAAEWAAREAERRYVPLTLCHVVSTIAPEFHLQPEITDLERQRGEDLLETAAAQLHAAHPTVEARRVVTYGQPGEELVAMGHAAATLVVGARGHGGFGALLLGSASDHVLTHASCPVVIVRGESWRSATPIVLGVDEKGSPTAAAYAFDMASAMNAPLIAVHAFPLPQPVPKLGFYPNKEIATLSRRYGHKLSAALAPLVEKYPEVTVEERIEVGSPGARLLEASVDACLLVVGTHSPSGVAALLLGSVSRQVVHHAQCPVAVIRN